MAIRSNFSILAVPVVIALCSVPALGQHGQDPAPAPLSGSPNGADPTAQSVNEQQLLQQLHKLEGRITIPDYKAAILQQPQGRNYQTFHERILPWAAGILIVLTLIGLAAFYFIRGRIALDAPETGIRIARFNLVERLTHWMTATAFIVLALTGLNYIFGKRLLFPLIGPEAFSTWSQWAKFVHDTIAWPFIIGIVVMLVTWIRDNIPDRYDVQWLREFGGFMSGRHPPARRFNAGQKFVFWSVIVFGLALAVTGILMLFPFWALDINGMQWAQYVHAAAGAIMIAVILGHIYIGTVGMQGAAEAMVDGDIDLAWARAHHSIWAEEQVARSRHDVPPAAAGIPAE